MCSILTSLGWHVWKRDLELFMVICCWNRLFQKPWTLKSLAVKQLDVYVLPSYTLLFEYWILQVICKLSFTVFNILYISSAVWPPAALKGHSFIGITNTFYRKLHHIPSKISASYIYDKITLFHSPELRISWNVYKPKKMLCLPVSYRTVFPEW